MKVDKMTETFENKNRSYRRSLTSMLVVELKDIILKIPLLVIEKKNFVVSSSM